MVDFQFNHTNSVLIEVPKLFALNPEYFIKGQSKTTEYFLLIFLYAIEFTYDQSQGTFFFNPSA